MINHLCEKLIASELNTGLDNNASGAKLIYSTLFHLSLSLPSVSHPPQMKEEEVIRLQESLKQQLEELRRREDELREETQDKVLS